MHKAKLNLTRMSIGRINKLFPERWVLVGDPELDRALEVKSGMVLWHGRSHAALLKALPKINPIPRGTAEHYTGELVIKGEFML